MQGLKLSHWGRTTHICVGNLTIIGSDNGLSPDRRQAIIWTNAGILLIGPLGINFNEILIGIQTFSFKKIHLKISSAKWRRFCLGLNVNKKGANVEPGQCVKPSHCSRIWPQMGINCYTYVFSLVTQPLTNSWKMFLLTSTVIKVGSSLRIKITLFHSMWKEEL